MKQICRICGDDLEKPNEIKVGKFILKICDACNEMLYEYYKPIVEDNLDREPINPHEAYD